MKKLFTLSTVASCLVFAFACKKDTNSSPVLSAVGFWRGDLTENEASIAMLNQPDGSSSFYAMITSLDTTVAEEKFYGHYTIKDGAMKAILTAPAANGLVYDSLTLETLTISSQAMTGIVIINEKFNDSTKGVLTPSFNLVRQ